MGILKSKRTKIEDNKFLDKNKETSTLSAIPFQERSTVIRGTAKNVNEKIITIEKIKEIIPEEKIITPPQKNIFEQELIDKQAESEPKPEAEPEPEQRPIKEEVNQEKEVIAKTIEPPKAPVLPKIDTAALEKQKAVLQKQVDLEVEQYRKKLFADIEQEKKYTLDKPIPKVLKKAKNPPKTKWRINQLRS
jgi:hypothetical protein